MRFLKEVLSRRSTFKQQEDNESFDSTSIDSNQQDDDDKSAPPSPLFSCPKKPNRFSRASTKRQESFESSHSQPGSTSSRSSSRPGSPPKTRRSFLPHPHLRSKSHNHAAGPKKVPTPNPVRTMDGLDFTINEDDIDLDLHRTNTAASCPNSVFTHVDDNREPNHIEHPVRVDTSIGTGFGF